VKGASLEKVSLGNKFPTMLSNMATNLNLTDRGPAARFSAAK
jgi:hypothetical protein